MPRIQVVRTLIFEGEEWWVRQTLEKSWLAPDRLPLLSDPAMGTYRCARELARTETVIPETETIEERDARWRSE